MHYVLYLPDARTSNVQHLHDVGLGDHAAQAELTVLESDRPVTEEHRGGVLVSWQGARPPIRALPELHWLPAMPLDGLAAGRYLIGLDPANRPEPWDLLKPKPFAGTPVGMGDGNLWSVPLAARLPHDVVRNPRTGTLERQPRPQFHRFWMAANAWQQLFLHHRPGDALPGLEEQVEFVEEALRLNYRLTPELISYLRLLNTGPAGTVRAILAACLHLDPDGGA